MKRKACMMKKILCILVFAVILCVEAAAESAEYDSADLSEALVILKECGGEPDEEELQKLYSLGLSDEDIDGLTVINSLRKDKNDITPYIAAGAVIIILSAAAVVCVVLLKKKT